MLLYYAYRAWYDEYHEIIIASSLEKAKAACQVDYDKELAYVKELYMGEDAVEQVLIEANESSELIEWQRNRYAKEIENLKAMPLQLEWSYEKHGYYNYSRYMANAVDGTYYIRAIALDTPFDEDASDE